MFSELLRFELKYQSRQLSWWFGFIMFAAFGYFLSGRVVASGHVSALSPHNITYGFTFLTQLAIFTTTLITAHSALRDQQYEFSAFVESKPIAQWRLVLSRFAGLYLMSLAIVLGAIVMMFAPKLIAGMSPSLDGEFSLSYLLWPLLVIVLPNVLFVASILFFTASIFRTTLLTFLSGIAIYILYFVSNALLDSPIFVASDQLSQGQLSLVSVIDPFAVSAFIEQTQLWTSAEKNTQLISLSGSLLLNRMLWLVISVLLIVASFFGQQRLKKQVTKFSKAKSNSDETTKTYSKAVKPTATSSNSVQALWHDFKLELKMTLRGLPFVVLMVFISVMVIAQLISAINYGNLVGTQYPYTSMVLPHISKALNLVGVFVVVFFAGEIIWRAKEKDFFGVISATQIPQSHLLISKLLVLTCLIFIMLGVSVLSAIGYQWWNQFYQIEFGLYLVLIPLFALPLFWSAVLCLSLQSMVPNKYAGYVLSGGVLLIFKSDVAAALGLEHSLILFGSTGAIQYSDFNGFDFFTRNIFWFSVYWTLVSALIALLAYGLSKRKHDESLLSGMKRIGFYLTPKGVKASVVTLCLLMSTTGYVYYNTNVVNDYVTAESTLVYQAEYETKLKHYKHIPSPKVEDVFTEVAFYPSRHGLKVSGHFVLTNRSESEIKSMLITIPNSDTEVKFEFDREVAQQANKALSVVEVTFNTPLESQASTKLTFDLSLNKVGFKNRDKTLVVLENGSYFHSRDILPFIGYNSNYELTNKEKREQFQLGIRNSVEPLELNKQYHQHNLEQDGDWIHFETIVSTEKGQIATAPGELVRQWQSGPRAYFHYKVPHKIPYFLAFSSGRYEHSKRQVGDVEVNAYYHLGHNKNIETMLDVAEESLVYYQQEYGTYPLNQLNLVEIPYRSFARAYPGTIYISENVGFKEDLTDPTNLDDFSNVIAHEIAHQWWGHQLVSANTEGALLMIESLADFSALMVMKNRYGEQYVERLAQHSIKRYLSGRSADTIGETSLHKMQGQHYLRYAKGPVIYNAIRHLIGESNVNQALKSLLQSKAFVTSNYATSFDLIKALKAQAPVDSHDLIDEWLTEITLYDLAIVEHSVSKTNDDEYLLELKVEASKSSFSDQGTEHTSSFNHGLEVAVFNTEPSQKTQPDVYPIQMTEGKGQLSVVVKEYPKWLKLDPKLMYIDRAQINNQVQVKP